MLHVADIDIDAADIVERTARRLHRRLDVLARPVWSAAVMSPTPAIVPSGLRAVMPEMNTSLPSPRSRWPAKTRRSASGSVGRDFTLWHFQVLSFFLPARERRRASAIPSPAARNISATASGSLTCPAAPSRLTPFRLAGRVNSRSTPGARLPARIALQRRRSRLRALPRDRRSARRRWR